MAKRRKLHEVWGVLVAQAWDDHEFELQLLADPRQALAGKGFELPDQLEIRVLCEGESGAAEGVLYLPYPASPRLSDEQLEKVAGGGGSVMLTGMDSSGLGELGALQVKLRDHIVLLNPAIEPGRIVGLDDYP